MNNTCLGMTCQRGSILMDAQEECRVYLTDSPDGPSDFHSHYGITIPAGCHIDGAEAHYFEYDSLHGSRTLITKFTLDYAFFWLFQVVL